MSKRKVKGFRIGLSYAQGFDELALRLKYDENKTGPELIAEALELLFSERDRNPQVRKVESKPKNKEKWTKDPAVFKIFRISEIYISLFDGMLARVKYTEDKHRRALMEEALDLLFGKYDKSPNFFRIQMHAQQEFKELVTRMKYAEGKNAPTLIEEAIELLLRKYPKPK